MTITDSPFWKNHSREIRDWATQVSAQTLWEVQSLEQPLTVFGLGAAWGEGEGREAMTSSSSNLWSALPHSAATGSLGPPSLTCHHPDCFCRTATRLCGSSLPAQITSEASAPPHSGFLMPKVLRSSADYVGLVSPMVSEEPVLPELITSQKRARDRWCT